MKTRFLLFLFIGIVTVSCVSTKSTLKNVDDNAPDLVLGKDNVFIFTEFSSDKKYGYDKDYPINLFYKNTKNDSINQPRFLKALAGPNGEEIKYKKIETCCPFPTKKSEMGVGLLDVYEITWEGQTKPVRLYLNIFSKGYLKIPVGFTLKKKV